MGLALGKYIQVIAQEWGNAKTYSVSFKLSNDEMLPKPNDQYSKYFLKVCLIQGLISRQNLSIYLNI